MATTWTVTDTAPAKPGQLHSQHRERIVTITSSGTNTATGDSLTAAQLGFTKVVYFGTDGPTSTGYFAKYDYTNSKLQILRSLTAAALADPGGLDPGSVRARVIGY